MKFSVYLIITKRFEKYFSYVGYAKDIDKRIFLHNSSRGAKYTKGKEWHLAYKKTYSSKSTAMKEEYKLKKNYILRNKIKNEYIKKNEKKYFYNPTF